MVTEQALRKMIAAGESTRQEFKSWVKCKDYRQRKELAVKSAVALANTKGGVLLFGVEDDGTITGCPKSDPQALMEAIYDMTRPSLFTEIEPVETSDGVVLVVSVEKSSSHVATTGGIYYRRLGNVTKPYYPANDVYSPADNPDFSAKIVEGATESDIDLLEVYRLKEKLRIRDAGSALPDLADTTFLDNLNLIRMDKDEVRVTVAGLLFVGKAASIARLLPQAEVIYLHYSDEAQTEYDNRMDMQEPVISILDKLTERIRTYNRLTNVQVGLFRLEVYDFSEAVFQEALLNALAHRSYEDMAPVYVKHYPTKIVIENPGGFPGDINESNIITHQSIPRNKLIAMTLQHLKYVQRSGQGVDIMFQSMLTVGAFWAGMVGTLFAANIRTIEPTSFNFYESVILFAIVILGGSGSIAGVVLGAFLLIGLQDVFREFESARMLIFGAAMMVMMIICPQGLLPPRRRFYNARFLVGRFPRGVQRAEPAREEAL